MFSRDWSSDVCSSDLDIGTGTYTVMSQIAAAAMGVALDKVEFRLGDSSPSQAPLEGGSATVSSVGSAVQQACALLQAKEVDAVQQFPGSHFAGASLDAVTFAGGRLLLKRDPSVHVDLGEVVRSNSTLEAEARVEPGEKRKEWATATHSAVFVEVRVDEALGTIRVARVVSAIA